MRAEEQYYFLLSSLNGGSTTTYLLDTYGGASGAYSLQLLSSTYTGNCVRVRRSSDNTYQTIGFIGNSIDTSSLLSFCGGSSGYVEILYDQSGNGGAAVQLNTALQPRIVNSGTLETDNGKPAIYLSGTTYLNAGNVNNFTSNFLTAYVGYASGDNQTMFAKSLFGAANNRYAFGRIFTSNSIYSFNSQINSPFFTPAPTTQSLLNYRVDYVGSVSTSKVFENNTEKGSTAKMAQMGANTLNFLIGGYNNSSDTGIVWGQVGKFQELVVWANTIPDTSLVNAEINSRYTIY